LIWIADANIVASDCAIQDMVDKCVDGARLVHQIPWGVSGPSVKQSTGALSPGSMLIRWYFATAHGRPYTVINNLFCSCVSGMSNMISKPHLEKIGGLNVFADHLAEDSHMGTAFDKQGYEVTMSKYTGLQNLGAFDISNYIERRVRWARLRMQTEMTSRATPFELVIDSHLFSWMCLISLSCYYDAFIKIAIIHPFAWFMVDAGTFVLLDRAVGLPTKWQDNANNNYFFDWGRISDKPRGIYFFIINMFQHYVLWIFREFIEINFPKQRFFEVFENLNFALKVPKHPESEVF
jgi:cellulose synthase/poly-beta-1,6-N-acetylglucosamine synthase-like glycosyltransferase